MTTTLTTKQKAERLHHLHHSGKLLLLPNIWDPFGALLLEDLGYEAVATASAAMAYSNGVHDGEFLSFEMVLSSLTRIAESVNLPVTADIESGYAESLTELEDNLFRLVEAGIVGINLEDTDKETHNFLPIDKQCQRLEVVRKVREKSGIPLFLNARTDVYIHGESWSADKQIEETIKRGKAYKEVGADCIYPIVMRKEEHIKILVDELKMPINILTLSGIPDLRTLEKIGVVRVSLGPSLFKYAVQAMKQLATKLKTLDGLEDITGNTITSDVLKQLINKSKANKG